MTIKHITSLSQLDQILSDSKGKLSVIDFHATWCGPCHAIAPIFESLSKRYPKVNFLKCDVDAAQDVASHYGVSAMPTFIFLKGNTKVDQVRGANRRALEDALTKHASDSASATAFQGKGQTLGGSTSDSAIAASAIVNLNPQVKVFLGLLVAYLVLWYLSS